MLALAPLAGTLLPPALADGITRAWRGLAPGSLAAGLSAGVLAAFLAAMASRLAGRRLAIPAVAAVAAVALAMLKFQTYPAASRIAGTREFYGENRDRIDQACLGQVRRHVAYGLRHLSEGSLTGCDDLPKAYRIEGEPPRIASSESGPERPGTLP